MEALDPVKSGSGVFFYGQMIAGSFREHYVIPFRPRCEIIQDHVGQRHLQSFTMAGHLRVYGFSKEG